jgi:predicted tellurium resistance membrane protein TerC
MKPLDWIALVMLCLAAFVGTWSLSKARWATAMFAAFILVMGAIFIAHGDILRHHH